MLIAHRSRAATIPTSRRSSTTRSSCSCRRLNPDGVDIVKNWYDKTLGTPYEGTEPPELYHKYVGHDNNRDWYAFTQVETQLTVDKIHNVWHPQIVHDIHQQGANGSRLFLPPYMQPVEPNVPKQIVEGYTELGNSMAKSLRDNGLSGHHDQLDLRRLDAGPRLFALPRRRTDFVRDRLGEARDARHEVNRRSPRPADDGYDPQRNRRTSARSGKAANGSCATSPTT